MTNLNCLTLIVRLVSRHYYKTLEIQHTKYNCTIWKKHIVNKCYKLQK